MSGLDVVVRRRSAYNDNTRETLDQEKEDDLPEDLMAKLEDHTGDEKAAITVSGSLSSMRDFHKAEAFVSIKVTCNNDLEDIEAVHGIVLPYIHRFAQEDLDEMSKLRDPWLEPHRRMHVASVGKPPPSTKTKKAPTSLPVEESSPVKSPPKRTTTKNKGVKKPSFRR